MLTTEGLGRQFSDTKNTEIPIQIYFTKGGDLNFNLGDKQLNRLWLWAVVKSIG